jgi:hypothetical protein
MGVATRRHSDVCSSTPVHCSLLADLFHYCDHPHTTLAYYYKVTKILTPPPFLVVLAVSSTLRTEGPFENASYEQRLVPSRTAAIASKPYDDTQRPMSLWGVGYWLFSNTGLGRKLSDVRLASCLVEQPIYKTNGSPKRE